MLREKLKVDLDLIKFKTTSILLHNQTCQNQQVCGGVAFIYYQRSENQLKDFLSVPKVLGTQNQILNSSFQRYMELNHRTIYKIYVRCSYSSLVNTCVCTTYVYYEGLGRAHI